MEYKDLWDLESAMKVLTHDSVDSKLWAEAVEWLILYGPPEIRQLLIDASTAATSSSFPDLKPIQMTADGQACYDIGEFAQSLGIKEEEAKEILKKKEEEHKLLHSIDDDETGGIVH
jgi:hypothetical protein